ncbi:MAG: hypothetical protein AAFY24_26325 [Pseudomonadota bacterium]
MKDDKIKTKASATGVEIEAAGSGAARLTNALADALSPFTQPMGLLGDEIEAFRIHRRVKAIETLKRASERQDELGIERHPVSPKLLNTWLEKASLEADDDQILTEYWATVLAKSPEKFSALHAMCMDILSKIGSLEARVFQRLCQDRSDQGYTKKHIPRGIGKFAKKPQESVEAIIEKVFATKLTDDWLDVIKNETQERMHEEFSIPGACIVNFELSFSSRFNQGVNIEFDGGFIEEFSENDTVSALELLIYHGLVDFERFTVFCSLDRSEKLITVSITGASVTTLGARFAEVCL